MTSFLTRRWPLRTVNYPWTYLHARILIIDKIVCNIVYKCFTLASIMAVMDEYVYAILKSALDLRDKQRRPIPRLVQKVIIIITDMLQDRRH